MTLVYILKLDFKVYYTNVRVQKIDGFIFKIFEMIIANFQIEKKPKKAQFFQKTFLLANISIKMVLEIFFLTFNNINV